MDEAIGRCRSGQAGGWRRAWVGGRAGVSGCDWVGGWERVGWVWVGVGGCG